MHTSVFAKPTPVVAAASLLSLFVAAFAAPADEIYFRDGTTLRGKVVSQKDYVHDSQSGQSFMIPKASGFFAVDDGVRIIIFSTKQVDPQQGDSGTKKEDSLERLETLRRKRNLPARTPPDARFHSAGPFNERGVRKLKASDANGTAFEMPQELTILTPHGVELTALGFSWRSLYLLTEFDRKTIRDMIIHFPELAETPGKPEPSKRLRTVRFLMEAKMFPEAEKELDDLARLAPGEAERVADAREKLRETRVVDTLDQINRSMLAGQFRHARSLMQGLPTQGLPGDLNVRVNTVRVRLDILARQWELADRYLRVLPEELVGEDAELFCEAAEHIRNNLYLEALERLEPFISLAEQDERTRKQGNIGVRKPEELLALAVTGWHLGTESAQTKPAAARKIWKAHRFVNRYLTSTDVQARFRLLKHYSADEPVELDELARIVSLAPPPQPDDGTGADILKRRARGPRQTDYYVQLPLDYFPGRPYPVLIVLNNQDQRPQDIIDWYRYEAYRNGFMLVAADWSDGTYGPYVHSATAHLHVLEVLDDLKQRFPIDTDRVFLSGFGHGANAAWDLGLSHPDLFAGVAPISSEPALNYTLPLFRNGQNLPFYIVTGDMAGKAPKEVQRVVTEMINRGYPTIHCVYRGRGMEWFSGELPYIFDWMTRKRRHTGLPDVGRFPGGHGTSNEEYQSMRSTDNRFWWLSSSDYIDKYTVDNKSPTSTFMPARMQGTIKPGNVISVYTLGLRNVALHLGPGAIDYSKPVIVTWRGFGADRIWNNNKKPLQPDLRTLMEDLRERGDRHRLVYVKIELPAGK